MARRTVTATATPDDRSAEQLLRNAENLAMKAEHLRGNLVDEAEQDRIAEALRRDMDRTRDPAEKRALAEAAWARCFDAEVSYG